MWDDEHISKHLLEAHLNPDIDTASRKKATIEQTVDWILDKANRKSMNILDLGCGPGLYAEIMAARGHRVVGVDFSKRSIDYARKQAVDKNLDIEYMYQNYLELKMEKEFDLAIMIYSGFGVLSPQERARLLVIVRRALKSSGAFIFDVLNEAILESKTFGRDWKAENAGFWSNKPYLVLLEAFHYPEEKVMLDQYIVIDDTSSYNIYYSWHHYFAPKDLKAELEKSGFIEVKYYSNVLPDDPSYGHYITFYKATNSRGSNAAVKPEGKD